MPDDKDWTWVLKRPCPDCGFDAQALSLPDLPRLLTENAQAWVEVLSQPDVAARPEPATWSPLEYAAHVRDVHHLFAQRLQLMLTVDSPVFPPWNQDAAAVSGHYQDLDPGQVAQQLVREAGLAAQAFAAVRQADHGRPGIRGDGGRFTVLTLAQYYAHEPVHHLWDVTYRH